MTPIESKHDIRLTTLVGVLIETTQSLSLSTNRNPELILAEALYLVSKQIHETDAKSYIQAIERDYPLLKEAIN